MTRVDNPRGDDDFQPTRLWWPARLANALGSTAEAVAGQPLYSLAPEDLLGRAMRRVQLTDPGPDWPDEAFQILARSLDEEARLTPVGRRFAHRQLVEDAATRLRIVEALKRQPEVLQRPVNRPIVMINLPRCGSTLLQFLLARVPETRSLWPWEIADPVVAGAGTAGRVAAARQRTLRRYRVVDHLVPTYGELHPMEAGEPEECTPLLARSFMALDLGCIYDVPTYTEHVISADLRPAYRLLRAQVQLIQGEAEESRTWVLRTPAHLFATRAILDVFPDALIVQLHREPLAALTSFCSLAATLRQANSTDVDLAGLGPRWMEWWARGLEDSLAARADAPATATFLDVDYRELVAQPGAVVDRIRRQLVDDPEPLEPGALDARVEAGQRSRPHRYRPEWFGLDPAAVAERYADYSERFDLGVRTPAPGGAARE